MPTESERITNVSPKRTIRIFITKGELEQTTFH